MTWTTRPRSEFGRLAAIRRGAGASLLLLHGVGLRAEAWNVQIDVLARHFLVIAPDMPGHGESPALDDPSTLAAYTDCIAAALSGPVLVAGHSMGAMIALDLAIRYPELLRGVAAVNAIYRRTSKAAAAVRERAAGLNDQSVADPSGTLHRWFGDAPSQEADACRAWLTSVSPKSYKAAYRVFAEEDGPADADLRHLACPALFLTGANEPNSTPEMSRAMAARTPEGQVNIIAGAAHMMPMTHPTEVNAALIGFFAACRQ